MGGNFISNFSEIRVATLGFEIIIKYGKLNRHTSGFNQKELWFCEQELRFFTINKFGFNRDSDLETGGRDGTIIS